MGKNNKGWAKFREKNPASGKDYEFGDPHPTKEGVIFKSYRTDKPIKQNGFYQIDWTYPKKRRYDGVDRINPKTNKPFLMGDMEIQDGKEMYFKCYNRNQVYESGERKGCYYETWWTKEVWESKSSDTKKRQQMVNDGFVPIKPLNPETGKEWHHGDSRINSETSEKEYFMRYGTNWSMSSGERYCTFYPEDKYVQECIRRNLQSIRKRAKKKGLEIDIDIDYLKSIFPKDNICPVLGTKMSFMEEGIVTSPSVDRINPKGGYTKDNIIWVSYKANSIKQDASLQDIKNVYEFYKALDEKKKGTPA